MTDKRRDVEHLNVIEGADSGAMGIDEPPESAPPGAEVDASDRRVPGANFERPVREAKPWYTSLAFEADQAGVANELDEDAESDEDDRSA